MNTTTATDTITIRGLESIKVRNRSGGVHYASKPKEGRSFTVYASCGTKSKRYVPAPSSAVVDCTKCQALA